MAKRSGRIARLDVRGRRWLPSIKPDEFDTRLGRAMIRSGRAGVFCPVSGRCLFVLPYREAGIFSGVVFFGVQAVPVVFIMQRGRTGGWLGNADLMHGPIGNADDTRATRLAVAARFFEGET